MSWRSVSFRAVRQRVALAVAVCVSAALLLVAVFGSRGLLHLRAIREEQSTINARIADLLRENERLRVTLTRLRSDDRYLERLARERLGFVRPGDLVHRFPPPDVARHAEVVASPLAPPAPR